MGLIATVPDNPIGWYLTYALAGTLLWWPYSVYWWRFGVRRTKKRIARLSEVERAQEARRYRDVSGPFRILVWLFPVGAILLVVIQSSLAVQHVDLRHLIANLLIWSLFIDQHLRVRFMLRALGAGTRSEPEASKVADRPSEGLPPDISRKRLVFVFLMLQGLFAVVIAMVWADRSRAPYPVMVSVVLGMEIVMLATLAFLIRKYHKQGRIK